MVSDLIRQFRNEMRAQRHGFTPDEEGVKKYAQDVASRWNGRKMLQRERRWIREAAERRARKIQMDKNSNEYCKSVERERQNLSEMFGLTASLSASFIP